MKPKSSWSQHAHLLGMATTAINTQTIANQGMPVAGTPLAWQGAPDDAERMLRVLLLDSLRVQLAAGVDHLAGLAAVLRGPAPGRSFWVIVRAVIDALAPAWWILEPAHDHTVRSSEDVSEAANTMTPVAARLLCYLAADARQLNKLLRKLNGPETEAGVEARFAKYEYLATLVAPGNTIGKAQGNKE
jgi:hypothetical protein